MPSPTTPYRRPAVRIVLMTALVTVAAAGTAAAGERSDTVKIDPGSSSAIALDFQDGPAMQVEYDVQVQDGPNIDIMVMDNANYQKYGDGESFRYVSSWSVLDTGSATQGFTLEEHGTWYVVLDHTSEPDDGAQPATVNPDTVTAAWTVSTQVDVGESVGDGIAGLPAPGAAGVAAALAAAGLAGARLRRH